MHRFNSFLHSSQHRLPILYNVHYNVINARAIKKLIAAINTTFKNLIVWLVGWLEFNIPFQHKYGYIRDERSRTESYPLNQWRKASDILTSTLATILFSSHSKNNRLTALAGRRATGLMCCLRAELSELDVKSFRENAQVWSKQRKNQVSKLADTDSFQRWTLEMDVSI